MSRSLIVSVLVAFSFTAFGQEKKEPGKMEGGAAMPTPTPSKELESWMKPMEGSWTCETRMVAGAMGPNSPEMTSKSTVKFMKDKQTNGMWYRGEYSMPKTKQGPGMAGFFMMSHDDANKMLVTVSWDNMGGASMGTGTLQGETMTWTGETLMNGQRMKTRDTMTKTGTRTATHKFEADQGKGFMPMGEDTCTKTTGST